jgi:hypothetical protein
MTNALVIAGENDAATVRSECPKQGRSDGHVEDGEAVHDLRMGHRGGAADLM